MYLVGTSTSHIILPPPRKYQLVATLVSGDHRLEFPGLSGLARSTFCVMATNAANE